MAEKNTQVAQQPKTGLAAFNEMIKSPNTGKYIESVLGSGKETFISNLTALVANSAALQECDRLTIMYAALNATSMGLSFNPNLGQCYVIPYKDNKNHITVAQFQMGAKGFKQLAARSGEIVQMNVTDVREGEVVSRDRKSGTTVFLWIEDDAAREKAKIVGYNGYIRTRFGYEKEIYMTVQQLDAHAKKYSKTYRNGYGVWKDNFDAMARKTIYKMMLSGGDIPISVETQRASDLDQAVFRNDRNIPEYLDNSDSDAGYNPEQAEKAAKLLAKGLGSVAEDVVPENASSSTAPDGDGDNLSFDEQ